MRRAAYLITFLAYFISLATAAMAQDEGEGASRWSIAGLIERSLSSPNSRVRITDFRGVLSASPRIKKITVADRQGVWLTLNDVQMDWTRTALFSGKLEIERLSAQDIIVSRFPLKEPEAAPNAPPPSAIMHDVAAFKWPKLPPLPQLPVTVQLQQITTQRISVPVYAQQIDFSLAASFVLDEAQGQVDLTLNGLNGEAQLKAAWLADQGIALDYLNVKSRYLTLFAEGFIRADGRPRRMNMRAALVNPEHGETLELPFDLGALGQASVQSTQVKIVYDTEKNAPWYAKVSGKGMKSEAGSIDLFEVVANGEAPDVQKLSGQLSATASGVDLRDRALQQAVGPELHLEAGIVWDDSGANAHNNLRFTSVRFAASDAQVNGEFSLSNTFEVNGKLDLQVPDIARFAAFAHRDIAGASTVNVEGGFDLLHGDFDASVAVTAQNLAVGDAHFDPIFRGASRLNAHAMRKDRRIIVENFTFETQELNVTAQGEISPDVAQSDDEITLEARLANLAVLLPDFPGAVQFSGRARTTDAGYALFLNGRGPGALDAQLSGTLARDMHSADVRLDASARLALANSFLGARRLSGMAQAALRLNGPLALEALSGSIAAQDATMIDPALSFNLEGMNVAVSLDSGRAEVSADARVSTGGTLTVDGNVDLKPDYVADLTLTLEDALIHEPSLFQTQSNAALQLRGPLLSGAKISGNITLADTEIKLNAPEAFGGASVPPITHIHASAAQLTTLRNAGFLKPDVSESAQNQTLPPYALDITITAPNRLFIRGRGLDAELGGTFKIGGTTENIIPLGEFTLIRGRLNILGRRINLSEASVQLQGDFDPYVKISATSDVGGVSNSVVISGSARNPSINFTSSPALPEEEVLANLLFGTGFDNLTTGQALQLANALGELSGEADTGIGARLRRSLNLSDLDVETSESGAAQISAGRYITDNLYSKIVVGSANEHEVQLNLDLSKSIILQGRTTNDDETTINLLFQHDY